MKVTFASLYPTPPPSTAPATPFLPEPFVANLEHTAAWVGHSAFGQIVFRIGVSVGLAQSLWNQLKGLYLLPRTFVLAAQYQVALEARNYHLPSWVVSGDLLQKGEAAPQALEQNVPNLVKESGKLKDAKAKAGGSGGGDGGGSEGAEAKPAKATAAAEAAEAERRLYEKNSRRNEEKSLRRLSPRRIQFFRLMMKDCLRPRAKSTGLVLPASRITTSSSEMKEERSSGTLRLRLPSIPILDPWQRRRKISPDT